MKFLREKAISNIMEMAHPGGESSNSLFEVLEDWEEQLKHVNIDLEGPGL